MRFILGFISGSFATLAFAHAVQTARETLEAREASSRRSESPEERQARVRKTVRDNLAERERVRAANLAADRRVGRDPRE